MRPLPVPGKHRPGSVGPKRPDPRLLIALMAVVALFAAIVGILPGGAPRAYAAGADSPGSCNEVIDGIAWNLDPCIPVGGPYPQDFADTLAALQSCPAPSPSPSLSTSTTGSSAAARQAGTAVTGTSQPLTSSPTTLPPTSTSTSATPTGMPTGTGTPTGMPTGTPTGMPTGSTSSPPTGTPGPCPSDSTPTPDPSYSPPASPTPSFTTPSASLTTPPTSSPTAPPSTTATATTTITTATTSTSASTSASATSASSTPPADTCAANSTTATTTTAALPGEAADLIECRDPKKIPDPGNPIAFVATGDSVTSAHNQTGFGIGTCDNTASDARKLTGNDANFSYAGKYFAMNKQIVSYYNFARTGFTTDDIRNAAAAATDACGNAWNRNDTPLNLAVKAIKAAKAANQSAYFVTTGGVNNTNWTSVVAKLAECQGLGFAVNTLLAGAPGVTVKFYYVVPKLAPTDPLLGLQKNIIKQGGACYATVKTGGWFPQTWWTRVGVPQYDGPGSANVSALAKKIGPDATAIVNAVLGAGADKAVWMLYYDINPANIDIANLALATANAKFPAWAAALLPATVRPLNAPLIDPLYVPDVRALVTNLNATITKAIPANAKVAVQAAPALAAGDIQNTAIGGSPHPNDNGHTRLANTLDTAYKAL